MNYFSQYLSLDGTKTYNEYYIEFLPRACLIALRRYTIETVLLLLYLIMAECLIELHIYMGI